MQKSIKIILYIILSITLLFSIGYIISVWIEYKQGSNEYEDLQNFISSEKSSETIIS